MLEISKYLKDIMEKFNKVGQSPTGKGVTRLGYSPVEDQMHETFKKIAEDQGLKYYRDQVGNSYAYLKDYDKYDYIGSHLDSVVEGGKFDGVLGVALGLAVLLTARDREIDIPLKVIALRTEESSNFMYSMIGSKLITGNFDKSLIDELRSLDGKYLKDIFKEKGYTFDPEPISDIKNYIEVHIEQGRVLEEEGKKIGLITTIAGSSRFLVDLRGFAEHSGATPMNIRKDSLCAGAEIILNVEKIGKIESETSVGTVGYINNTPNSMNVISRDTRLSIDFRDIDNDSMADMKEKIKLMIKKTCQKRNVKYELTEFPISPIAKMNEDGIKALEEIAKEKNISYKLMHSGAGHDAMIFSKIVDTNMIFIPCYKGISHNPNEKADLDDAALGGKILLEYLERINYVN